MFRNSYTPTPGSDSITYETPTYLNQNTGLESTTCGSIPCEPATTKSLYASYTNPTNFTTLESTTCGSLTSQSPSKMSASLLYTGALLNNPTPKAEELIQQMTQKINDKNNLAKQPPQQKSLYSDNNNMPTPAHTQNPSQNQVTINVFQQHINVTINFPTVNFSKKKTTKSNKTTNYPSLQEKFNEIDPIPWDSIFLKDASHPTPAGDPAKLTGESFYENTHYSNSFHHPLNQLSW